MSDIYFFTDVDLLEEQTAEQAFGPLPNELNGYDCFRYTDRHTFSNDANAYAICKGKILVQPVAETELVNIVLKPEVQPCNCPPVKFYIYRGIRKESLIENDFVAKNTCTLAKSITTAYPEAPKRILGVEIPENAGGVATDYLETAFYRSYEDFELWSVNGGWSIGKFDAEYGGFEIMLDRMCFNPTFSMVRGIDNICQVEALTGNETEAAEFDHWHQKEDIHNYLDPAALFGNQFDTGVKARTSNGDISSDLTPKFETKKKEEIYTQILQAGHFHNKNTIYVDIRNELNYSFNYFGTYDNNLKLSFLHNENPSTLIDYYRILWPILLLRVEDTLEDIVKIAFPKGDNKAPLIFIDYGETKKNTINQILQGDIKFESLETGEISEYTIDFIELKIHKTHNGDNISTYNRIIYINQIDWDRLTDSYGKRIRCNYSLDNLFQPLQMQIPFVDSHKIMLKIYEEKIFCDRIFDCNRSYMIKRGIIRDDNGNTIFWGFNIYENSSKKTRACLDITTSYSDVDISVYDYFLQMLHTQHPLKTHNISINEDYTESLINEASLIFERKDFNPITDIVMISLSKDEYESLIATASQFNTPYDIFIGIKRNIFPLEQDENGEYITKYELVLRGIENKDGSLLQVKEVDTGLTVQGANDFEI